MYFFLSSCMYVYFFLYASAIARSQLLNIATTHIVTNPYIFVWECVCGIFVFAHKSKQKIVHLNFFIVSVCVNMFAYHCLFYMHISTVKHIDISLGWHSDAYKYATVAISVDLFFTTVHMFATALPCTSITHSFMHSLTHIYVHMHAHMFQCLVSHNFWHTNMCNARWFQVRT